MRPIAQVLRELKVKNLKVPRHADIVVKRANLSEHRAVPTRLIGERMRSEDFIFVALLLAGCGSQTTSLDRARSEFLAARADYQVCMNAGSTEVVSNCEPKRLIADDAERKYRDAMSAGLSASH